MERDHPQEVVIASPSGSPELKRQKCEDDDLPADLELDGLLAPQDDAKVLTDAGAPAWAVALQNSLQHQIQRSQGLMMTFHERLQRLESKEPQCNSDYDRRLQNLERMLAEFTGASAGQVSSDPPHPSGRTPTARPDYRRVPPPRETGPPTSAGAGTGSGLLTDYSHIVIGGWPDGTRRDDILSEAKAVIQLHRPALQYSDLDVYGKRASVCHLHFQGIDQTTAFEQYVSIRNQLHEKHRTSSAPGASLMWFSASKPLAVRLQNRKTMGAKTMIESFLSSVSSNLEVDVEWRKAILWVDRYRVAADKLPSLMAEDSHRVISISTDSTQPEHTFHFNITRLSNLTGSQQDHIEKGLFTRQ